MKASLHWKRSGDCPIDEAVVRYRPLGTTSWDFAVFNPYSDDGEIGNLQSATQYEWRVVFNAGGNNSKLSKIDVFTTPSAKLSGIEEGTLSLENAVSIYPNPFSGDLTLSIFLSNKEDVKTELYDFQGKLVKVLFNGQLYEGQNTITYSNNALESGVYFIKIISNQSVSTHRIVKQ